jgi:hypothetical protein
MLNTADPPQKQSEPDILAAAARVLRSRAQALRRQAAPNVQVVESRQTTLIVGSVASRQFQHAKDLDALAAEIEAEARS